MKSAIFRSLLPLAVLLMLLLSCLAVVQLSFPTTQKDLKAVPFLNVSQETATPNPTGYSPTQILSAYNLPSNGGSGTIAIVDAYDDPNVLSDANIFSSRFGLPSLGSTNFEKHMMSSGIPSDPEWCMEISLDVQWAHAIAPNAKILLVEATSADITTYLIPAVDYARSRSDVVSVSMSWGIGEEDFPNEMNYDTHFTSAYGAHFFASSGDDGYGVNYPAASPNVVAVGGTTLDLSKGTETAWSGSGGGRSTIESVPYYQSLYNIPLDNTIDPNANGRGVPDVSFDAAESTGPSIYDSIPYNGSSGWWHPGGTSFGSPAWAAINAISHTVTNSNLYALASLSSYSSYFRDITSGNNKDDSWGRYPGKGDYAKTGYDYVTGLGSPRTANFAPPQTVLTIAVPSAPAGGATVQVDGVAYTAYANSPVKLSVPLWSLHTVQPIGWAVDMGTYEYCYVFSSWADGSTAYPRTVPATANLSLTAYFTRVKVYYN